jgi:hypothetical protein
MNAVHVTVNFEPGHLTVRKYCHADGSPWSALEFTDPHGRELTLVLHSPEQVAELEAALREVREYLTNDQADRAA